MHPPSRKDRPDLPLTVRRWRLRGALQYAAEQLARGALQLASPQACCACDAPLVDDSWGVFCDHCGPPEPAPALHPPPGIDRLRVGATFVGAVAQAIRRFKFHDRRDLSSPLSRCLALPRGALSDTEAQLVPVPAHPLRLRKRGYNPAALLATALARTAGAPVSHVLTRSRFTAPQHRLRREGRLANLRGAFSATRCLRGRWVVLVDDVVSTGATLGQCALALREAGAVRVDAWAVASPPLPAAARGAGDNDSAPPLR